MVDIITKTGKNYPYVQISIRIYGSDQNDFITIQETNCLVDTGFSGGLLLASSKSADLSLIGKKTVDVPIKLAGGMEDVARCCKGYLTRINEFEFPMNSVEITVCFLGEDNKGLAGLNLLKSWIAEFHGPNRVLTIFNG